MPETNYVHEHIAGNFMDVLKNVVYISVVKAFQEEHPEGVILVETHSGPVRRPVVVLSARVTTS
jgi:23S rRNA A2030 N6-methylase RlmJ